MLLKFWSKSIIFFLLIFNPISITLRDVTILTDCLSKVLMRYVFLMLKIHPSHLLRFPPSLKLHAHPLFENGMTPLGLPLLLSRLSFLWVLLCRYVFFPTFIKPTMKYLPLAKALALGRPYALGTILLASIYQAMSKYVFDEPYH